MKNLVLLAFLVAAIACLSLPTPIQPNPYVTTYTQACRYDMEQNLLNVNGRIVPRWYYTGRCYAGKSLETSCQYLQAIPQDYTNCVIQVSGNCQMTNGQFSPGSYENFVSHACCPPKWSHPHKSLKYLIIWKFELLDFYKLYNSK